MPNFRIEAKRIRPPADWKYVGEIGWPGRVPWWRLLVFLVRFSSEFSALAQSDVAHTVPTNSSPLGTRREQREEFDATD